MIRSVPLAPSSGIHLARVGADIVVLDTAQDSYTCLIDGASYLSPIDDWNLVSVRDDVLEQMLATGWVQQTASPSARTPHPHPERFISGSAAVGPAAFVGVAVNALAGDRQFRRATLEDILRMAERYKYLAGQSQRNGDKVVGLVRNFFSVLPWLPGQGLCLHRCFLLLRYLAHRGVACDWVFGVRTWPFAAHCWLVIDDAVLGDELDRVRAFTPILVV